MDRFLSLLRFRWDFRLAFSFSSSSNDNDCYTLHTPLRSPEPFGSPTFMFPLILLLALPDFADKPLDLIDDSELSSSYASDRFLFSLYDYLILYVLSFVT